MPTYDYQTFNFASLSNLQEKQRELGAEGWRTHTCEPYVVVGQEGVGSVYYLLSMEFTHLYEPPQEEAPPAAMACTG